MPHNHASWTSMGGGRKEAVMSPGDAPAAQRCRFPRAGRTRCLLLRSRPASWPSAGGRHPPRQIRLPAPGTAWDFTTGRAIGAGQVRRARPAGNRAPQPVPVSPVPSQETYRRDGCRSYGLGDEHDRATPPGGNVLSSLIPCVAACGVCGERPARPACEGGESPTRSPRALCPPR